MDATTTLTHEEQVRLWVVTAGKGVIKRVAAESGKSRVFVHDVLYGRRRSADRKIERLLAAAGAPGFAKAVNTEAA